MTDIFRRGIINRCAPIPILLFAIFSFFVSATIIPEGLISISFFLAFFAACFSLCDKNFERKAIINTLLNAEAVILVCLIIFAYISISAFWSKHTFSQTLVSIWEYRFYICVPIFFICLSRHKKWILIPVFGSLAGYFLSNISSWALIFGLIESDGLLSWNNRIFHGLVTGLSMLTVGFLALRHMERNQVYFMIAYLIAFSSLFANLMFGEVGRTGYLIAIITTSTLIVYLLFARKFLFGVSFLGALMLTISVFDSSGFDQRVNSAIRSVSLFLSDQLVDGSAGERMDWYRYAIFKAVDFPFGVGVANVESTLRQDFLLGIYQSPTNNVHSELFNNLLIGGWILALIFVILFGIFFVRAVRLFLEGPNVAASWLHLNFFFIIMVQCLFNSGIKDFGEKHLLMVAVPLLLVLFPSDSNGNKFLADKFPEKEDSK